MRTPTALGEGAVMEATPLAEGMASGREVAVRCSEQQTRTNSSNGTNRVQLQADVLAGVMEAMLWKKHS